jgi:hypothetical protein
LRPGANGPSLERTRRLPVMAGLVPAIHAFSGGNKNVDARDRPAHDAKHRRIEGILTTDISNRQP